MIPKTICLTIPYTRVKTELADRLNFTVQIITDRFKLKEMYPWPHLGTNERTWTYSHRQLIQILGM